MHLDVIMSHIIQLSPEGDPLSHRHPLICTINRHVLNAALFVDRLQVETDTMMVGESIRFDEHTSAGEELF